MVNAIFMIINYVVYFYLATYIYKYYIHDSLKQALMTEQDKTANLDHQISEAQKKLISLAEQEKYYKNSLEKLHNNIMRWQNEVTLMNDNKQKECDRNRANLIAKREKQLEYFAAQKTYNLIAPQAINGAQKELIDLFSNKKITQNYLEESVKFFKDTLSHDGS